MWKLIIVGLFITQFEEDRLYGHKPLGIKETYVTEDKWVNNSDTINVLKFHYISEGDTMNLRMSISGLKDSKIPNVIKKHYNIKKWTKINVNDEYVKVYHPIFLND